MQVKLLDLVRKTGTSNMPLTQQYADSCVKISLNAKDYKTIGELYKTIGQMYYFKANYEQAYKNYTSSINYYAQIKDSVGIAGTLLEIGNFYKRKNDLELARNYYIACQGIALRYRDTVLIANSLNSLGLYFESNNSLDSALKYYNQSYQTYKSINNLVGMSYSLDYMAGVYKVRNQFKESLELLTQSIQLRKQINDKHSLAISLVNIGELYFSQKQYNSAISYFVETIEVSKEIDFADLTAYTYKMLAACYQENGDYKNAYFYLDSSQIFQRKVDEEMNSKQLKEVQEKYETDKKIELLKIKDLEISKKNLKLNRTNIVIYSLMVFVVLLILTFYLLYNRYKLKQQSILNKRLLDDEKIKANAVIEAEEKERQRIGKDLHDGIGQLLSAVKLNLSGLNSHPNLLKQDGTHMLDNSIQLLDDSVQELRSISHNLMPTLLLQHGLIVALREMCEKINHTNKILVNFTQFGIANSRLPLKVEIVLYRVIQELINNILKHAKATKVDLQLIKSDDELTIMLEDNGVGFDYEKMLANKNGIGISNIITRLNYIKGTVVYDTQLSKGTTIHIEIDLKDQHNE